MYESYTLILAHTCMHIHVCIIIYVCSIYRIAGNIGGELNLADWRFASRLPN